MANKEQVGYARLARTPTAKPKTTAHYSEVEERADTNSTTDNLHWKNPTLMAGALLTGLIFALIHHFFYDYWNGKVVLDETQQQWITRGGTFFAFAFKVALAAGGGVAYVQFLWLSLRQRAYRVRDVDSMFTVLSNPLAFRLVKLWVKLPFLAVVAALVWLVILSLSLLGIFGSRLSRLMPLAAIITPGSLTVILTPQVTSQAGPVPSLGFNTQMANFGATTGENANFAGATSDLIRIALASATSGSILSMEAPQPNSSYTISFPGPAVKCSQGSDADLKALINISTSDPEEVHFDYMAWVPRDSLGSVNLSYVPLQMPGLDETDFTFPIQAEPSTAPGYNLYVFAPHGTPLGDVYGPAPFLLQCTLYNVTYKVDFKFDSGIQFLDIQLGPKQELIPMGAPQIYGPAGIGSAPDPVLYNEVISYLSLMEAYGKIITGSISTDFTGGYLIQSTIIQSTLISQRLAAAIPTSDNATVCAPFEELFQNITLSLFSSSQYLLNTSIAALAATAPTPIITSTVPVNKYSYNALSLLAAYGAALLGEIICLTIGFYALYINRKTYTNDFSSIMRATRRSELDALVVESESNGADPAAEHMLNALISYQLGGDRKAGFGLGKEE
jgi:hypothetical protein